MNRKRTAKPYGGQITTPPPSWLSPLEADTPQAATESNVKLTDIHLPQEQPRRYFDPEALQELVSSVKQHGILQPLLVRPLSSGGYELVAGERRWRAAQAAGLEEVPVVVRELSDQQAFQLALIENLQREDLNPVEETEGILHLLAIRLESNMEAVKSLLYRMKNANSKGEDSRRNVSPKPETSLATTEVGEVTDESRRNVSPNSETDPEEFRRNVSPNSDASESSNEQQDVSSVSPQKESRRNVSPNLDEETLKIVQEVFDGLGLMNWLSFTTKRLPLLNLPKEILADLREGKLEYTKAQALARVKDNELRKQLLSDTVANNWSLSEIKEQIKARTEASSTPSSVTSTRVPERLKDITQRIRKRRLWENPEKQNQLETLLGQLEALLNEN
ncbi:ParB/RepB/Spo0J family partition protein [Phormidium sp. LEGE 05292]|uniref:ParB/RepB/Spo0J family partition protein n=1 Tax=[Phormidium] sp. LEGE 05292 TaxID=767427 RepID=UPI001880ADB4|nr:ParB/RepB/Spo0J family partition protein [Phormidium sp. LEGE 05292]MBE9224912.1 ParB/RepB/Spo0J family partition protein [Phormidium sp. LEGE 05292]